MRKMPTYLHERQTGPKSVALVRLKRGKRSTLRTSGSGKCVSGGAGGRPWPASDFGELIGCELPPLAFGFYMKIQARPRLLSHARVES